MKKHFFLSLNTKILLVMLISFVSVSTLFLWVFSMSYANQLEQQSLINRKKAERLWEMYQENETLRSFIKQNNTLKNKITLLPDRSFSMRQDLLADIKGAKNREKQMDILGYFIFLASLLVFFSSTLLWFSMRRWIIYPIERLLKTTNDLANGHLERRVPISLKRSKDDELDLLAQDFNKMADNIALFVEKIKENESFLQNLIDTLPDGVCVIDQNHSLLLTNQAYDTLNNNTKCRQKCYHTHYLTQPCTQDQNPCPLLLLKENPNTPIKVIHRTTDLENKEKYFEVSAATLKKADSFYIIEIIRPLDKEIIFSHQQKLSSVGMLASSVAHEMRNPLGSIRLILEDILDRSSTDKLPQNDLNHYLTLIYNQITHCIEVTSRLLKLSRRPEKDFTRVNLNEIVSETSALLDYEAKKRGIELVLQLSDVPAYIQGSDAELRMVAVNLIQNALQAMNSGGKMTLTVTLTNEDALIYFIDTGSGIPAENLRRIFEPFFSQKPAGDKSGTGLGLPIAKTIIDKHNGHIFVESIFGKGTTFKLRFDRLQP